MAWSGPFLRYGGSHVFDPIHDHLSSAADVASPDVYHDGNGLSRGLGATMGLSLTPSRFPGREGSGNGGAASSGQPRVRLIASRFRSRPGFAPTSDHGLANASGPGVPTLKSSNSLVEVSFPS